MSLTRAEHELERYFSQIRSPVNSVVFQLTIPPPPLLLSSPARNVARARIPDQTAGEPRPTPSTPICVYRVVFHSFPFKEQQEQWRISRRISLITYEIYSRQFLFFSSPFSTRFSESIDVIYVPGYDRDKHSRTQFLNRTKRRLSPALVGSRPFSLGGERTRLQFLRTRTIVYVLFFFRFPRKFANHFISIDVTINPTV